MAKNKKTWLSLAMALTAATAWSANSPVSVGDVPPDYLGKNGAGDKVRISDLRGKVVVVSFFATWCAPCRKEVPMLAGIQKVAGRDKLAVIAVDYRETGDVVRKVRNAFKDYEITFTHDANGVIGDKFGVSGIPHMVIVGADGKVAARHIGYGESSLSKVVDDINRIWQETQAESKAGAQ